MVYVASSRPELTTEEAPTKLGILEVIGKFTTGGFAPDSGQQHSPASPSRSMAQIVRPGETFSLNGHTGPRDAAARVTWRPASSTTAVPGRGIGGGISQFAHHDLQRLVLRGHAADVEHKEHSYYISRYPAAREATVFRGRHRRQVPRRLTDRRPDPDRTGPRPRSR